MPHLFNALGAFWRDNRAGITTTSLIFVTASMMLGAYGIDVSNVMMSRTKLQITADATAHSALVYREEHSEAAAKAEAIQMAASNMAHDKYGTVFDENDIAFGTWDSVTRRFTPQSNSKTAVKVTTHQTAANNNAIRTYLFMMIGLDAWNVSTSAVFVTYQPKCLREGFVADGAVDLQSNNHFSNGFCIHSNAHVELNQNNSFEPGTEVSMPRSGEIVVPGGDFSRNTGLAAALQSKRWNVRVLRRIDRIIAGINAMDSLYLRPYITAGSISTLPSNRVSQADLAAGNVYRYTCSGNETLTIGHAVQVASVMIVTNCAVNVSNGVVFEDAVLATSSVAIDSIKATSGMRIGRNDNCAPGGGAQLVTAGGVSIPAGLEIYGGQILAKKDVQFAANANGIQGASIVSAGVISGTSNMNMAFCGTGMQGNYVAEYFKLAE